MGQAVSQFIDTHPVLIGWVLLCLGLALVFKGGYDGDTIHEPDGCVFFFGLALVVWGFLGIVGIIT